MPFTRNPLDYQINRLLLKVGMFLEVYRPFLPRASSKSDRSTIGDSIAEYLELDKYIDSGVIKGYYFRWAKDGRKFYRLRTIHLIPTSRVRRTPGIHRIKRLFFDIRWKDGYDTRVSS